ncbi:hypothetical protein ACI3LY_000932 [Candidozyma auris]|uniref:Uncharacterized protein n=1 Tax=Candidozyma auris TaxID=498019 RepID=A0A2H1A807_CANAR|nr:hypothetical_protein [[Candida] auris]PIS58673.1 hypothetical protein B9J08_000119 [[Candida] auris]QEO20740.1 hypothetical_protein [[Candida] auris]
MSGRGGKALTIIAIGAIGWYTGVKFWQPLIVEQLKKDGNLRDDIYIREVDDQPSSWNDVKTTLKETLNPSLKDVPREELKDDLRHAEIKVDSVDSKGNTS